MKVEYKFVTGEKVSVEVYGKLEEIMLELDKELKNNNRKEIRRHESLNLFDRYERNADITTDIFGDVLKNFDENKLYDAISKLKPQEQELIHKLYLDEKPITQVDYAKELHISYIVLRKRIERIRRKLSNFLKS